MQLADLSLLHLRLLLYKCLGRQRDHVIGTELNPIGAKRARSFQKSHNVIERALIDKCIDHEFNGDGYVRLRERE